MEVFFCLAYYVSLLFKLRPEIFHTLLNISCISLLDPHDTLDFIYILRFLHIQINANKLLTCYF